MQQLKDLSLTLFAGLPQRAGAGAGSWAAVRRNGEVSGPRWQVKKDKPSQN